MHSYYYAHAHDQIYIVIITYSLQFQASLASDCFPYRTYKFRSLYAYFYYKNAFLVYFIHKSEPNAEEYNHACT